MDLRIDDPICSEAKRLQAGEAESQVGESRQTAVQHTGDAAAVPDFIQPRLAARLRG